MIHLKRYTADCATDWDRFVDSSRNGTFLFRRAYMDYHADRFTDHSLIFTDESGKTVALMPANGKGNQFYSHQGLTYGGLVLNSKSRLADVMECLEATILYLRENGFKSFHYKQMPTIYHRAPSQEDDYALWRNHAELEVCNIATTVDLHPDIDVKIEKCRRRRHQQAESYNFNIEWNASLDDIWPIITESLEKHHQASPVHTKEEMQLLQSRLPENIKTLIVKRLDGSNAAGAVLYITDTVVHVQYAHATMQGYDEHVMDFLYFELIQYFSTKTDKRYFDFGTSNEQQGKYVNLPLVAQKEGFAGRGIAYRQWKIEL